MVLPAPPPDALSAPQHWLHRLVVALQLASRGVLTLVTGAVPARLRDAYLQLRAYDPATEVALDAHQLAALAPGSTALLVVGPATGGDELDWINLNRPILADRRLSVVLWCAPGATAALARRAPDLFDWISAQVECPPAPAPHAVADVAAAIRARAHGVVWHGAGIEATLAAIRPGRPVRRIAVTSYRSMLDALTSSDPGWLVLEGIATAFQVRRLRWAMAEAGRRVIVFRQIGLDLDPGAPGWWIAPGWWSVNAALMSPAAAAADLARAGCPPEAAGRLAALTGLDPDACMYACHAVRQGVAIDRVEALLADAPDPRAALHALARQSGWPAARVIGEHDPERSLVDIRQAIDAEAARWTRDHDPIVSALRGPEDGPEPWASIGREALQGGDFEVAIRWLTTALQQIPSDGDDRPMMAELLIARGRAQRLAGVLPRARDSLELAYRTAQGVRDAALVAASAGELAYALLDQGEPQQARAHLESALSASRSLGDSLAQANLLDTLARALVALDDKTRAVQRLDRAYAMKRRVLGTDDHPAIAVTLSLRGLARAAQDDLIEARRDLERALEILDHGKQQTGIDPPSSGAIWRALARVERAAGDLRRARACLDRALAIQRTSLGTNHPDVADTLVARAGVLADLGDLDGAIAALDDALAIQRKVFGHDGQLAGARTRQQLAHVLRARGDITGAIDQLEHALATRLRLHERDDHPELTSMRGELEHLQALQGRLQRPD